MTTPKHPMQPVIRDPQGTFRFKGNAILMHLFQSGVINLNEIDVTKFAQEDVDQFWQLLGLTLSGYEELSFTSDLSCAAAHVAMMKFRR